MTGILPLVTATAVGLFAMQPRTVWRQGGLPAGAAKRSRAAERAAPRATQPLGGVIDDPLPRDYNRSGRELPGPVQRPASPIDGGAAKRREGATAGLRDVIPTVKRAAASKPVEGAKPRRLAPRRYEAEEPAEEAGAKETAGRTGPEGFNAPDGPNGPDGFKQSDGPKGQSLGSARLDTLPEQAEDQEQPQAKTEFTARPSDRKRSASLAKNETSEKSKNAKASKKAPARGEPPSPSDQPQASRKASGVPSGALVGLFASLGANVFLLWVAASQRHRYRALVRDMFENDVSAYHANDADGRDDLPHWEEVDEEPNAARAAHANDGE